MLQQDLQADENQDHAAAQLRPGLEATAEHTAHTHPHRRKHKGDGADQGSRPQDLPAGHAQKGKADPHRQGIDAGGHRQGSIARKPKEASSSSSSAPLRDSRIMLPPMKLSSTKATQWSMLVIASEKRTPSSQPMAGINP